MLTPHSLYSWDLSLSVTAIGDVYSMCPYYSNILGSAKRLQTGSVNAAGKFIQKW